MDSIRSDDDQRSSSTNNTSKARILRSLASCFFIVTTFWASTLGQEKQYAFNYSIIQGSGASELHSVLEDSVAQRLLLDIASQPRAEEYVNAALRGTNVTSKQLLGYELVRRQEGAYIINFLLFTKDDERRMREITESHAHALANAILNRRAEVESILKEYELSPVDPRAALFIILGCFSLDWDGLALTAEKGYRNVPSFFERIFPRRIIHGWEPTDLSRRGFYKGSHNTSYGSAMLTSFGDHEIQPRHAFPDVLWSQSHLPDSLKSKIAELTRSSSEKALGKEVGAMMLALRQGGRA